MQAGIEGRNLLTGMTPDPKYWFPAKRHGWGWGWPQTWQGRVVLSIFFVLLGAGAALLLPDDRLALFLGYTVFLCCILMSVCYAKGEPPRWR